MPRAGWVLLLLVGCQGTRADKPPADARPARFGPTPARVELSPTRAPRDGKDQLFVASVFDADGDPRRNRRVEWSLDGPGKIVAVTDAWLAGRSRVAADGRSAASFTALVDGSTKRGDGATAAIRAGQAWCRVSGATGDTTLTAKVPDIPDPARQAATAGFTDDPATPAPVDPPTPDDRPPRPAGVGRPNPPPAEPAEPPSSALALDVQAPGSLGVGQAGTVTLTAANRGAGPAAGVLLMVRLPAGLELDAADPDPPVRQGPDEKDLRWGLGELPAGGRERVTLKVRATRPGSHRLTAGAEADDGTRDDRDVTVTADTAGLGVSVEATPAARPGDRVSIAVVVTNTGRVPVRNATAFVTADPELMTDLAPKEVAVGTLAPGETKRASVKLVAARPGRPGVWATVTADGGLTESGRGEVIIGDGDTRKPPERKPAADRPERAAPVEPPAEAKPRPTARPDLVLEIVDRPGVATAGGRVRVHVKVRNRGTGPARGVEVSAAAEGAFAAVGGTGADGRRAAADAGKVTFTPLPELKPGKVAVFEVELSADRPGGGRLSAAVRADHLSRPLREEHEVRARE